MAVKERLWIDGTDDPGLVLVFARDRSAVVEAGEIQVEIINGNVVVTIKREDEAKFGPVSVVVV